MSREEAWGAHLVVKVKEPQPEEFGFLRNDMVLFTYLHLAAYPQVGEALLEAGTAAIAYETVQLENGSLPLLAPMSEIAGRLAAQVGPTCWRNPTVAGVLMGAAPAYNRHGWWCWGPARWAGMPPAPQRPWMPKCCCWTGHRSGCAAWRRTDAGG